MAFMGFPTMEDLCRALAIAPVNCTCDFISTNYPVDVCKDLKEDDGAPGSIVQPAVIISVAVIALLGNSTVVWMKTRKNERKSRHTRLITCLALCDIFFAVFVIIHQVPYFFSSHWMYGRMGCKVIGSLTTLGAWAAIGVILIIGTERYFGIVHPFRRGLTDKQVCALLGGNIFICICLVLPRFVHLQIHPEYLNCKENWETSLDELTYKKVYDCSMFVYYSIIPVIIITVLYSIIFRTLRQNMLTYQVGENEHMDRLNAERLHSNKRTMVLLVLVLIAFVVCTFPNKIRWIIMSFESTHGISNKKEMDNSYFSFVTEVMYSFHLAINPFIYAFADNKFRKNLKRRLLSLFKGEVTVSAESGGTESIELQ